MYLSLTSLDEKGNRNLHVVHMLIRLLFGGYFQRTKCGHHSNVLDEVRGYRKMPISPSLSLPKLNRRHRSHSILSPFPIRLFIYSLPSHGRVVNQNCCRQLNLTFGSSSWSCPNWGKIKWASRVKSSRNLVISP